MLSKSISIMLQNIINCVLKLWSKTAWVSIRIIYTCFRKQKRHKVFYTVDNQKVTRCKGIKDLDVLMYEISVYPFISDQVRTTYIFSS